MMAAEIVKIKVAQQITLKKDVVAHTFVFNEGLNQLKSDMGKIWFSGYEETNVTLTDLKKYVEQFSETLSSLSVKAGELYIFFVEGKRRFCDSSSFFLILEISMFILLLR